MNRLDRLLLLSLLLVVLLSGCAHKVTDERYENCKNAFSVVNEFALQLEEGDYWFSLDEDQKVSGVYWYTDERTRHFLNIPDDAVNGINEIRHHIRYDFSFISISDGMIIYGGIGPEIYVYSKDGSFPQFFLNEDTVQFKTYEVDQNWYRLRRNGYSLIS